jgi:hypothetical protein
MLLVVSLLRFNPVNSVQTLPPLYQEIDPPLAMPRFPDEALKATVEATNRLMDQNNRSAFLSMAIAGRDALLEIESLFYTSSPIPPSLKEYYISTLQEVAKMPDSSMFGPLRRFIESQPSFMEMVRNIPVLVWNLQPNDDFPGAVNTVRAYLNERVRVVCIGEYPWQEQTCRMLTQALAYANDIEAIEQERRNIENSRFAVAFGGRRLIGYPALLKRARKIYAGSANRNFAGAHFVFDLVEHVKSKLK